MISAYDLIMKGSPVKGAHMLSKGYIAAWADDRGIVSVIDKTRQRGYPASVTKATIRNYAYVTNVVTRDLEEDYSKIESDGLSAIRGLRSGDTDLSSASVAAIIEFLEMHRERGQYADQMDAKAPGVAIGTDGSFHDIELSVGDIIFLGRHRTETLRLSSLGLESWEWRVESWEGSLATGDGAVLLFRETSTAPVTTVTFPISPHQLLVIGTPLQYERMLPNHLNLFIAEQSRHWLVSASGTLRAGDLTVVSTPSPPLDPE